MDIDQYLSPSDQAPSGAKASKTLRDETTQRSMSRVERDGHCSSIASDASTIPEFDTSAQLSRRFGHCNVRSSYAVNAGSSTCLSNDCSISCLSTAENWSYNQS